ncbi:MAG: hypothetical protein R2715_19410 [Ilumatobacteraceae bacterium]
MTSPDPAPSSSEASATSRPPTSTSTTSVAPPLHRVLFIGDSTSWTLSLGVIEAMAVDGVEVSAFPAAGCGVGGATPVKYLNLPAGVSEACATWVAELPAVLANFDPEVVLVTGGLADLSSASSPTGPGPTSVNPPSTNGCSSR